MPQSDNTVRRQILFAGNVQGVGFRYTVTRVAVDYHVTGYVQNMYDGRVEVVVEGLPNEIQRFQRAIESQMSGYVDDVEVTEHPATGEFKQFWVKF